MLIKFSVAASVAITATQALADPEPMPYQLVKMSMSMQEMFGVVARDDAGYTPTQSICGVGTTCAEACGSGFEQCASTDKQVHCYNPVQKQACCSDGTGNSCNAGFYCTADTSNKTWCCPDSMDLTACAAKFGVADGLHSEALLPTRTSVSSTAAVASVSSSFFASLTPAVEPSSSTVSAAANVNAQNSTSILATGTGAAAATGNATMATGTAVASATMSQIGQSGTSIVESASILALVGAATFAILL